MNINNIQSDELTRRARAFYQACDRPGLTQAGGAVMSRRDFLRTAGAVLLGASLGTALSSKLWQPRLVSAHSASDPVPIPGGTPALGGGFHVFAPAGPDPADAEPSTITDFNGFLGLAYVSGTVTRTNTRTGEVRTLPFVNSDMRFMKGVYRGQDGQIHRGTFGFV